MVEKLGNDPGTWDLEKWFLEINIELDKLVTENNEVIFTLKLKIGGQLSPKMIFLFFIIVKLRTCFEITAGNGNPNWLMTPWNRSLIWVFREVLLK